jgi:hypothetical protein
MVASMKMAVFWVVAPCSLVEAMIALMMEAASTCETSVNFYHTILCNSPEDSHQTFNLLYKMLKSKMYENNLAFISYGCET